MGSRTTISSPPENLTFGEGPQYTVTKTFRLFFMVDVGGGLKQAVLIAKDGQTWRVLSPSGVLPSRGKDIDVPIVNDMLAFDHKGILEAIQVDNAPVKAIEEMWGFIVRS